MPRSRSNRGRAKSKSAQPEMGTTRWYIGTLLGKAADRLAGSTGAVPDMRGSQRAPGRARFDNRPASQRSHGNRDNQSFSWIIPRGQMQVLPISMDGIRTIIDCGYRLRDNSAPAAAALMIYVAMQGTNGGRLADTEWRAWNLFTDILLTCKPDRATMQAAKDNAAAAQATQYSEHLLTSELKLCELEFLRLIREEIGFKAIPGLIGRLEVLADQLAKKPVDSQHRQASARVLLGCLYLLGAHHFADGRFHIQQAHDQIAPGLVLLGTVQATDKLIQTGVSLSAEPAQAMIGTPSPTRARAMASSVPTSAGLPVTKPTV